MTRPAGSKREVTVGERGGATFAEADLIGLYTATGKGDRYPFAAIWAAPASPTSRRTGP